jgi:outer membrane protein TolC
MASDRFTRYCVVFTAAAFSVSCAGYRTYEPAALEPAREGASYSMRRLDDPLLAHFLTEHGVNPGNYVTPTGLALASVYFRSDVAESSALVEAARAAEITARARPFPSASATIERNLSSDDRGGSPWTVSLTSGLTLETGGKRAARVAQARASTLAAELRLESTEWRLAQEARIAAVSSVGADNDVADAESESSEQRTLLGLLRARYAEGRISLADLAQAETDVRNATVGVTQTRRARTDARTAVSHALGVPLSSVEGLVIRGEARSACDGLDSPRAKTAIDTLETLALRHRFDVGVALADYAVAEARFRQQIAQQYPDLNIGPGILWDQDVGRWLLAIGTGAIPSTRNRGPIAEAEARRSAQAAHVKVIEDGVLAQVDSAAAACRNIQSEIGAANSLAAAIRERLRIAQAAYSRGETGRTELALANLALVRATHIQRQALQRRQLAGATLEAVVGLWLTAPGIRWPELPASPTASVASPATRGKRE